MQELSRKFVATVDSRISDAAGLVFGDTQSSETHLFRLPNPTGASRRGFRGGCFVGRTLYVCTSCEVHILEVEWAEGNRPEVDSLQVIQREDWLIGERAHADLHHLCYDPHQKCLLLANSFNDCIDVLSLDGQLIKRNHLSQMNPELKKVGETRNPKAADLFHLNHICALNDDFILTLANLNGSRKGALMSYRTGEILRRDLAFPHDGLLLADGTFAVLETEGLRLTLFPGITTASDIKTSNAQSFALTAEKLLWPRGLATLNGKLLAACSRFGEKACRPSAIDSSHIRVFEFNPLRWTRRIDIPWQPGFDSPVVYSVLPLPAA